MDVLHAREFAIAAHGDQTYAGQPYFYHLDAVASIVEPYGEVAQTIAYLHDVLEDTDHTHGNIEAIYGPLVADCVALVSDEEGDSRQERKVKTYAKLGAVQVHLDEHLALIVKAADRLANLQASQNDSSGRFMKMYRKEHPEFVRAVYRSGICDEIWEEIGKIIG